MSYLAHEVKRKRLAFTRVLDAPLNVVWKAWEASPTIVDFKDVKGNKTKILIMKSLKMNGKTAQPIQKSLLPTA